MTDQGAPQVIDELPPEENDQSTTKTARIETLEIEESMLVRATTDHPVPLGPSSLAMEDIGDEFDDDLRELLPGIAPRDNSEQTPRSNRSCCGPPSERVGKMRIFLPRVYYSTGWGIRGPHWFGPPCVLLTIVLATIHLVKATISDRPYTAATCTIFSLVCSYHLLNSAYRDPGLIRVKISEQEAGRDYCWCDFCNNYQPPGGAHCPDCNVCIAGYDHHCVWMGLCIGRNNFKQFVRFNLAWLAYLAYAAVWVKVVGPLLFTHRHDDEDNES